MSLDKTGWAGLCKIAFDRFRVYVSYLQLFMIAALYFKESDWHWWYLLFIPGIVSVIYIDVRYMLRGEQQSMFELHPYMPKMYESIKKIEGDLNELSEPQWKKKKLSG